MRYINHLSLLLALLLWGCTSTSLVEDATPPGLGDTGSDNDDTSVVVKYMDNILSEKYLYNDEYNTLDRDLNLDYNTFLPETLLAMESNILDNKEGKLYSTIYRTAITKSGESRSSSIKSKTLSFGLASAKIVAYKNTDKQGLGVLAVTADSPFAKSGITRGDIIVAVGGVTLTENNIYGYAQLLMSPISKTTLSITLESGEQPSVTSDMIYCSPIIKTAIFDESVGFLSYLSFDIAYDNDLLDVFKEFKNKGVTDLILDLRVNSGGYVNSANRLSTIIGGEATADHIFARYTYNPTRMESISTGESYNKFYSGLEEYSLNINRLFCLVDSYTASASEMVINSLRGIGFEVIIIGKKTMGKNVGMEVSSFNFDNWHYEFYPVTFAISNEEGFGAYENGFTPDYEVDDWNNGEAFVDYSEDEVLIKKALSLISETDHTDTATTSTRTCSREINGGKIIASPRQMSGAILTLEKE